MANQNKTRFIKAHKFCLLAGIMTFLIYFLTHLQADLFDASVIATLLGTSLFVTGTILAAFVLLPAKITPSKGPSSYEIKPDESPAYRYNDWYNDATNPASPVYQSIHRSTHQQD